jgi:transcriptional regulator with XRE-family HTH domain
MHNSSDSVTHSRLITQEENYTINEMTHFGTWLRSRRKEMRLTQGELATKAGISTSYVSTLERGERHHLTEAPPQPTLEVVDAIADALASDQATVREMAGYVASADQEQVIVMSDGTRIKMQGGRQYSDEEKRRFEIAFKVAYAQAKQLIEEENETTPAKP